MVEILEQLDAIDWKSYGVEYMPDLIGGLAAPDQKVRDEAYNRLEMTFEPFPPGVWEELDAVAIRKLLETDMPILVVPFFIELLQSEAVIGKGSILQLLIHMCWYRHYVKNEVYWERATQVFEAIKIGRPTYQDLINDANPYVKGVAGDLLDRLNFPDYGI